VAILTLAEVAGQSAWNLAPARVDERMQKHCSTTKLLILGWLLIATIASTPAWPQQELQASVPIIDVHVHLLVGRGQSRDFSGAVRAAIEEMDRFGIRKAIILPPPQVDAQQVYDYPAFDIAANRDVPIDLHMDAVAGGMQTPARFADADNPPTLPGTLDALERLLAHNPKARLVWAHGGSDPLGAMTPLTVGSLMDRHSNLFVSLRVHGEGSPMQNKLLAGGAIEPAWRALLVRHSDRFMIGTDSFYAAANLQGTGPGLTFGQRNVPRLKATIRFLSLLPLDIAGNLAHNNAVRVYKLAPP